VASTNGCLSAGLPPWHSFDFIQPHRKKYNGFKSVDRSLHFFQSTFVHNFRLKIPWHFCRNVELPRHVTATFVLVLQEAHPLNTETIYFPEHFCNTEQSNAPR
jgi:hypothetical protein